MKVRYERVPKDKPIIRPQARQHDPENLARLADSFAIVQLQPIGLLSDYTVNWGTGRVLAARMKPEITHLWAAIFEEPISEREFLRRRGVENFARFEPSNAEKCQMAVEYAKAAPDLPLKQIAADLGVDPSMLTRWTAWERVTERVQQALTAGAITLQQMYDISKHPDQQDAELDAVLAGRKRGRSTNGEPQNGQQGHGQRYRSKLILPCGMEFTVDASEMSLEGLRSAIRDLQRLADEAKDVETLCEAMKVAKAEGVTDLDVLAKALKDAKELANDQELDLRTLMTVAKGKKDKSKKGA